MDEGLKKVLYSPGDSYAKIKIAGNGTRISRVPLPFSMGSSSDCDVILNSSAIAPCAKIVFFADKNIFTYDVRGKSLQDTNKLQSYGLKIIGPIAGGAPEKPGLSVLVKELLAAESQWFASLPSVLRFFSGGPLRQPLRLGTWAIACLLLAALCFRKQEPPRTIDLSTMPIDIKFGGIYSDNIGSVEDYRSFANGITYRVLYPTEASDASSLLLTFDAKGLSQKDGIVIRLGRTRVFSSEAERPCVYDFCTKSVIIEKSMVAKGENLIVFEHKPFDGDYVIKNVLVDKLNHSGLKSRGWYA